MRITERVNGFRETESEWEKRCKTGWEEKPINFVRKVGFNLNFFFRSLVRIHPGLAVASASTDAVHTIRWWPIANVERHVHLLLFARNISGANKMMAGFLVLTEKFFAILLLATVCECVWAVAAWLNRGVGIVFERLYADILSNFWWFNACQSLFNYSSYHS